MEIWKYGNMKIWKYENMEVRKYGNMEVRKYGKGLQGILLNFNGLLGILHCFCDSR